MEETCTQYINIQSRFQPIWGLISLKSVRYFQILVGAKLTTARSMVGVSCVLISKLKAAGPQFQLGSFAVGQIEMFFPEEGVTQMV